MRLRVALNWRPRPADWACRVLHAKPIVLVVAVVRGIVLRIQIAFLFRIAALEAMAGWSRVTVSRTNTAIGHCHATPVATDLAPTRHIPVRLRVALNWRPRPADWPRWRRW